MEKHLVIDEDSYKGKWVALDPATYEVVSHHAILKRAISAAKRKGIKRPLLHHVPKSDGYFVGGSTISAA